MIARDLCLQRRDFVSADGVALSKLRAVNNSGSAAWVVVRRADGNLDPWFISEGNCKTIVFATPREEFDGLSFFVSPKKDEALMPWPVQGGQR